MNLLKYKNLIYFFLIAIFALTACSKSSNPNPSPTPPPQKTNSVITTPVWPANADVYFTGITNSQIASYWKNGVLTVLGSQASQANAIAVNNKDIYVAGNVSKNYQQAVLWKNGVSTTLSPNSQVVSEADAIVINGGNIYVAGAIDAKAVYWKNGVTEPVDAHQLLGSVATAIAVSGNDVYRAGYSFNISTGFEQACYWKNGVLNLLSPAPLPGSNTQATGIAVSGSDVYVSGFTNNGATLWKNGEATSLPTPSRAVANGILISRSDIYVSGFSDAAVTYWKNGTAINLSPGNISSLINASYMALDGNDVYVAGGLSAAAGGSVYWRNGVPYLFSKDIVNVNSMTIVPH
jgi:hypothetical protein